jgi:hypothetical protein
VNPTGFTLGPDGSLYVSDGARVRKISVNGVITTVAGTGTRGYSGDGGPALDAQLALPGAVALDSFGNLYITDEPDGVVRIVYEVG